MAEPRTEIIPYIFYESVPAALEWLARAFGFAEELRHATPSGMHAQMTFDGQRIMMGQGAADWHMASVRSTKIATQGVFIYLADVDAHYERARVAGAEIVHPPKDEPYGRTYTARDLDGHPLVLHPPARIERHQAERSLWIAEAARHHRRPPAFIRRLPIGLASRRPPPLLASPASG